MQPQRTLVGIPYSPWTERARWALEHHRVPYRFMQYVPMLGELPLRVATGKLSGALSVPILIERNEGRRAVFDDSFAIATHAESIGASGGSAAPLIPEGASDDIAKWNDLSERSLAAGRRLFFGRMIGDRDALNEALPKQIPKRLRGPLVPVAKLATQFVARKYESVTFSV